MRDGDTVVAQGRRAESEVNPGEPVTPAEAAAGGEPPAYAVDGGHPFPTCFVCGPGRARATACASSPGRWAMTGTRPTGRPDASLADADGRGPAGVRLGRARLPHQRAGAPTGSQGPAVVLARLAARDRRARASRRAARRSCRGSWAARVASARPPACSSTRAVRRWPARARCGSSCGRGRLPPWPPPRRTYRGPVPSARPPAAWRYDERAACVEVRGDAEDVFSHGFICPKAHRPEAPARGPRPAAHAARQAARRQLRRGDAGTRR